MKRRAFNIDLEKLLNPISLYRPAGESLRYEGIYDQIREARREDDANLEQGIYVTELKRADWLLVEKLCLEAIETRSKDLQVAVWLMEAWVHIYGFAGIRHGFELLLGLCESFWDAMYPLIEEGDLEFRFSTIEWVNDKLAVLIKLITITSPTIDDAGIFTFADWEDACRLESLAQKNPAAYKEKEDQGKVTLSRFNNSLELTPRAFISDLHKELEQIKQSILKLEQVLERKCGNQAPSLLKIKSVIAAISHLTESHIAGKEEREIIAGTGARKETITPFAAAEDEAEEPHRDEPRLGRILSRAEAYRRLSEVADYLLRTEPHSPTPYLLKRAVAWGGMSLPAVFNEIIRDSREMSEINRLLHFYVPADNEEDE